MLIHYWEGGDGSVSYSFSAPSTVTVASSSGLPYKWSKSGVFTPGTSNAPVTGSGAPVNDLNELLKITLQPISAAATLGEYVRFAAAGPPIILGATLSVLPSEYISKIGSVGKEIRPGLGDKVDLDIKFGFTSAQIIGEVSKHGNEIKDEGLGQMNEAITRSRYYSGGKWVDDLVAGRTGPE